MDYSIVEFFPGDEPGHKCGYCKGEDSSFSTEFESMMSAYSVVKYYGSRPARHCGYCGQDRCKYTHGMWTHSLTVQDYQDLIDRGWRRSGKYCYKPTMNKTCCPQYPIKCAALDFKISKSQKKTLKQVQRYLRDDIRCHGDHSGEGEGHGEGHMTAGAGRHGDGETMTVTTDEHSSVKTIEKGSGSHDKGSDDSKGGDINSTQNLPKKGVGADPCRPACKKAKQIRLERKQQKLADKGMSLDIKAKSQCNNAKSLDELLQELTATSPKHKLEIKLVRSNPPSEDFDSSFLESFNIYKKYQMTIHGDDEAKLTQKQFTRFLVDSPLQIKLVRSSPRSSAFEESFDESYNVYKRYQMSVHQDKPSDCDKDGFIRFLVDSPLQPLYKRNGVKEGYGSFHQQYWLDGKLIAVGVLDILPQCISSVYLFYDPDYSFLSLGTYTALREIHFTTSLNQEDPDLKFYYMGYYIHSCPKMRYKVFNPQDMATDSPEASSWILPQQGHYYPSFLCCPEVYSWVPIEKCCPKLEANKYSRFEDDANKVDKNADVDISRVSCLNNRRAILYGIYKVLNPEAHDDQEVMEYAKLTGKTLAERLLLFRG